MRDIVEAINAMESQILEADRNGSIEGVILRYGLFYGPHNPATQKMLALTRRRMLPVVSGDASLLPCIHIDDAVSATVAAVDYGTPGSAYDIVDDEPVSMTDLVSAMAHFTGAPPPRAVPAWLPRLVSPYLAQVTSLRVHLSNEKAKTELHWRPAYPTIRDGLAQAIANAA